MGGVRQVEKIVDHQLVIRLDVEIAGERGPILSIGDEIEIDDAFGIGAFGIARPHPESAIPVRDGVAPQSGLWRDDALSMRVENAVACLVEAQPMTIGSASCRERVCQYV